MFPSHTHIDVVAVCLGLQAVGKNRSPCTIAELLIKDFLHEKAGSKVTCFAYARSSTTLTRPSS